MKEWFEQGDWSEVTEHQYAPLPEDFPVDWLRQQVEREERVLRMQYEDGELPPRDEMELARRSTDTPSGLYHRRMYLYHLYLKRSQNLHEGRGDGKADVESREAMRKLLRREPVVVEIDSRTVEVTGRSYAAMLEIARHYLRLMDLETDIDRAKEIEEELTADERSQHASRLKRVRSIHRRLLKEATLHRRAIYAHLLTDSGAPADSLEDAPDWWDEIGPAEDAALLIAAWQAGPGRLQELGQPPEPDVDASEEDEREYFGWQSLFGDVEREMDLEPASLHDRDLYQLVGWLRSSEPRPVL